MALPPNSTNFKGCDGFHQSVERRAAESTDFKKKCQLRERPGPFALQAAIAAVHCRAAQPEATDWSQILGYYDALMSCQASPVVALNRSVAVAMVAGPAAGLALIEELSATGELAGYHLLHAARADLQRRLGLHAEAALSYEQALEFTTNASERRFLQRRLRGVSEKRLL